MKHTPVLLLIVATALWISVGCNVKDSAKSGEGSQQMTTEAAETADVETSVALPTMLELGSEGCKPCEQMKPVMAGLEADYGEKIRIVFHDVRKHPEIAKQHGIRLIPTQIFLDADGHEFYRHEGFFARDSIETVFRGNGVAL